MRGRKKVKRGFVLLLLFLAAGLFLQPLRAAELQCGIWCPECGKWQENFTGKVPESLNGEGKQVITVSCGECSEELIEMVKWVDSASYDDGTGSWWEHYTVSRCHSEVIFPQAAAYAESGDSDNSYRVTADGDVFGATGHGWTTEEIYDEAAASIEGLFNSLYKCAAGDFTWAEWYNCGLSTDSSGEKSSPLISYMSKFAIKAVLQEELTPPILSVLGDASVQVYRNGELTGGDLKVGDTVHITPVKISGREYADYEISDNAENVSWNEETQVLQFTMPKGEVRVSVGYWKLQGLEVELAPLFYETYQREPYWDGESFNLDCEPPIAVEKDMLIVKAVVQHDRTLEIQERKVSEFTITGGNQIINLGENPITVKADVFGDGYLLEGNCILKADSAALKELMQETESETYTELKVFVETLTDNLSEYEEMIEQLSENLEVSEAQRAESERKLAEALKELEGVTAKLEESREKAGVLSKELEELSAELARMKETMTAMQEFLQQITGETEIEEGLLEKAKEEFETLKKQKEGLTAELEKLEAENGKLLEENGSLTEKNVSLLDKNQSLTEKNENLVQKLEDVSEENKILQDKLEGVMTDNTQLSEQLKYTVKEQQILLGEYERLQNSYVVLQEKNGALEAKNATLQEQNNMLGEQIAVLLQENTVLGEKSTALAAEKQEWQKKYELLLAEQMTQVDEQAMEKADRTEPETGRTAVELEVVTTAAAEQSIEAATKAEQLETELIQAIKPEQTATAGLAETLSCTEPLTTELYTTEYTKKEEADCQSASLGSGRRLLPGIVIVAAAMLLGGGILYISLEQKELPFKLENLKNLG